MRSARYRLEIEGELGARYDTAFEGMTVQHEQGNTVLVGPVTDRSHLHGLLDTIGRLGLTLVSVTPLEERRR